MWCPVLDVWVVQASRAVCAGVTIDGHVQEDAAGAHLCGGGGGRTGKEVVAVPCLSWWSGLWLQFLYRIQIMCRFLTSNRTFLSFADEQGAYR